MASSATVACPLCGQANSLSFNQWTENGAPHGAGYWPMEMSEVEQACECDLTEDQLTAVESEAWEAYEASIDADKELAAEMAFDLREEQAQYADD
jgi:hypothetical protein